MITKMLFDMASGETPRGAHLSACLEKIKADAGIADIFAALNLDGLEAAAAAAPAGGPLALDGIAVGIADNIMAKSLPNEASSALLAGFTAPFDAAAADNLKRAGATVVGKTRVPEFGVYPVDGEAAAPDTAPLAVTRGLCHAAFGVDAGGEFRMAVSAAGLDALKPTYGLVSRYGIVSAAPSMETVALATNGPADLAPLLFVIGGFDARDVTTRPEETPDFPGEVRKNLKDVKIGVVRELAGDLPADVFGLDGVSRLDVSLPSAGLWNGVHSILYHAEASSQLGRYDGIRFGKYPREAGDWDSVYYQARAAFTPVVKRAAMLGAYALSHEGIESYYNQALRLRSKIRDEFAAVWEQVDVLVVPTPAGAAGLGTRRGANLSGCAALAPAGKAYEIWAKPFTDHLAIKIAMLTA